MMKLSNLFLHKSVPFIYKLESEQDFYFFAPNGTCVGREQDCLLPAHYPSWHTVDSDSFLQYGSLLIE